MNDLTLKNYHFILIINQIKHEFKLLNETHRPTNHHFMNTVKNR